MTPARDMSDTALNEFLAPFDAAPPPINYTLHTAECAPDDDDGPAGDLRSMGGLVLAFKAFAVVALIELAVALL